MIFAPCCCNSYETFLNWFPYLLICTPFQPSLILQKCMTYIYWCYHPCYHPDIFMTYIHTHTYIIYIYLYIYIFKNTYCIYIGLNLQSSTPNCRGSGHPSANQAWFAGAGHLGRDPQSKSKFAGLRRTAGRDTNAACTESSHFFCWGGGGVKKGWPNKSLDIENPMYSESYWLFSSISGDLQNGMVPFPSKTRDGNFKKGWKCFEMFFQHA